MTPVPSGLLEAVRTSPLLVGADLRHSEQVTQLALQLFDGLRPLHGLGSDERVLLAAAALLHDIGWRDGRRGHHRRSCEMILADDRLPLRVHDRSVVALTARFHRRGLPDPERHPLFGALDPAGQRTVCWLGGLLRLADGLDQNHMQDVEECLCRIEPETIVVRCRTRRPTVESRSGSFAKAELLEAVSGRRCAIVWEWG